MKIGPIEVGPDKPPFIVAEMSGNHNHDFNRALRLIELAKEAGAQAIKLQTYTADTITMDVSTGDFFISDEKNLWKGKTLYQLYQEAYTPWEWHKPLFEKAKELGLIAFSTPFDVTAVDFLEELNVPCYKIASNEMVHLPLIEKAASTGKPLIISTGGATLEEIHEAVNAARKGGSKDLMLLKCTVAQPTEPIDSNLSTIPNLADTFKVPVGLSDHTLGIGVPIASIAYGACFIEKHLTIAHNDGAVDSPFSLEPQELKMMIQECFRAWQAKGKVFYGPTQAEKTSHSHRPSIFFSEDLKAGEKISEKNIRIVRPGTGLAPKYYKSLMGRAVKNAVKKGDPVSWLSLE